MIPCGRNGQIKRIKWGKPEGEERRPKEGGTTFANSLTLLYSAVFLKDNFPFRNTHHWPHAWMSRKEDIWALNRQGDLIYCHCSLEFISDNECSRTEFFSFGPNITENI